MGLLFGPKYKNKKYSTCILSVQMDKISDIWNDKKEASFGIERLLKLFFPFFRFFSISFWIECLIGLKSYNYSKLFIDIYVLLKLGISLIFLFLNLSSNFIIRIIVIYFIIETITILFEIFLVSSYVEQPISFKRSIILLFLNYIEINIQFAILYFGLNLINGVNCPIQALYFSFVSATTLGYGDFIPFTSQGYILIILQLLIMISFITLFFSNLLSELHKNNNK